MRVGIDKHLTGKKKPTTKTYNEQETNEKGTEKELSGKLVFPEQQPH